VGGGQPYAALDVTEDADHRADRGAQDLGVACRDHRRRALDRRETAGT